MTNETKLIRVLDRKTIPTSRGTCRGPIGPYRENLNRILVLISRGYNVVEVLPDNSEVKLNEINFDKDNTIIDVDDTSDESLGDTSDEEVNTNNTNNSNQNNTKNENAQPPETNRQLSKKERRQKAREQREQQNRANVNNNESSNTEKNEDVKPDSDVVPEGAIEE